jgi:putative MATE family efflux protein
VTERSGSETESSKTDSLIIASESSRAIVEEPSFSSPTTPALTETSETPTPPANRRYDRSIVEGPLPRAVWKIAWPTMLTNMLGGLQGIVDHVMVGHLVGFKANAAIGVAWQIIIVVIIFITSVFTGMSVLVARFAGAGEEDKVDRVVYQAFLTAIVISLGIMAPIGYLVSPALLDLVNAAPAVKAEALPFLRIMFLFSGGMFIFFLLSTALRSAGDARTPMILGTVMTVLNLVLNVILIRGLGPIPAFGTAGAAIGTVAASWLVAIYSIWKLWGGGWVVSFPHGHGFAPDWNIIRSLFRFGLPTGIQGIAMNIGGVFMLAFIGSLAQSAAAQAAFAISYTQLFSLVTWTSVGLMGAAATVAGQNLGAGHADRASSAVQVAALFGLAGAVFIGFCFLFFPRQLLAVFGMHDPVVVEIGVQLLRVLSLSGLFVTVALTYTGGLQGTGDTKSPLYISIISQIIVPLGICFVIKQTGTLDPIEIWVAILVGHATRCVLSVGRFKQGKWRDIAVDIDSGYRKMPTDIEKTVAEEVELPSA